MGIGISKAALTVDGAQWGVTSFSYVELLFAIDFDATFNTQVA